MGKLLILGDSNFAFSLSVIVLRKKEKRAPPQWLDIRDYTTVIVSSYHSEEDITRTYSKASKRLSQLRNHGIRVMFNVDATALEDVFDCDEVFHCMVWKVPLSARDPVTNEKIQLNDPAKYFQQQKDLVGRFFLSASSFLHPKGTIRLSICFSSNKKQFSIGDQARKYLLR